MNVLRDVLQKIKPFLNSYSEVFFLQGSKVGLAILFITCLNPNLGLSGLFAILSAYGFARFLGYHHGFLQSGYYTYNALLVGLSIGILFELSWLSLLFIVVAAMLTFILTLSLANVFYRLFNLTILSIPFVVVSSLIYLAASRYANLYVTDLYNAQPLIQLSGDFLPFWLYSFFKALGAIIFMPDWFTGLLISLMILSVSRVLFVLALFGFVLGTFLQGLFTGSYTNATTDIAAFNYILIAMALGGVFNIPSPRSYIIAFIGVALATVLISSTDVFWSQFGIPAFTLPFTVITLGMTYVLALLEASLRPVIYKPTPEQTAEYYHTAKLRYPEHITMHLPFNQLWSVWQGFNGKWTHKGLWQYAYDFVQMKEGKTHQGDGKQLTDYYCYQQQVCSPVQGYVVYVADQFPDNPIGMVDTINNWGNAVVIQDVRGYYVALCHLSQHQVFVKVGEWLEPYQVVGLCGNSGYSPQPHIHMQYQTTSYLASATMPFCFTGVLANGEFNHFSTPAEQTAIQPAFCHAYYVQIANFLLDQTLHFSVKFKQQALEEISVKTQMAADGCFYLTRNNSKLYFGKSDSNFYFYHLEGKDLYLKLLYQALPSLPFNYLATQQWRDYIPSHFLGNCWQQIVAQLRQVTTGKAPNKNAHYRFASDTVVIGEIQHGKAVIKTRVEFDPYVKFNYIQVGDFELTAISR